MLKSEQNHANIACWHKTLNLYNSSKITKFKKIFLILNSTLDELFNDTIHISLRWIYRPAKIDWTKKPIWVYSSSPHKWGRNIKLQAIRRLLLTLSFERTVQVRARSWSDHKSSRCGHLDLGSYQRGRDVKVSVYTPAPIDEIFQMFCFLTASRVNIFLF